MDSHDGLPAAAYALPIEDEAAALLNNDEGGQFLGGFAMSAEKRLGTLSRLWDRGEFDRVRVGDGSGSYYGRRLRKRRAIASPVGARFTARMNDRAAKLRSYSVAV